MWRSEEAGEQHCFCLKQKQRKERDLSWNSATAVSVLHKARWRMQGGAFWQYMECTPPSHEVYGALKCVVLQWATAASAEKEHDVEK